MWLPKNKIYTMNVVYIIIGGSYAALHSGVSGGNHIPQPLFLL